MRFDIRITANPNELKVVVLREGHELDSQSFALNSIKDRHIQVTVSDEVETIEQEQGV